MSIIGKVEIRPNCRKVHGIDGAFEEAVKMLKKNYKLFTGTEDKKTYVLQLVIKQE